MTKLLFLCHSDMPFLRHHHFTFDLSSVYCQHTNLHHLPHTVSAFLSLTSSSKTDKRKIKMYYSSIGILVLPFLQSVLSQQSDKYTDENRPYKFGFNIDGYQHRKEEKNEKGIIKGEYGFITADGYYRVTKYETDENNNFKIISQKNYYVGFPPENPTTTAPSAFRQRDPPKKFKPPERTTTTERPLLIPDKIVDADLPFVAFPFSSSTAIPERTTVLKPNPTTRRTNLFQGQPGCSHCIIPTTRKPSNSNSNNPNQFSVDYRFGNLFETTTTKQTKLGHPRNNEGQNLPQKQTSRKNGSTVQLSDNFPNDVSRLNHKVNGDVDVLKKNFNFPKNDSGSRKISPNFDPRDEKYLPKTQDLFKSKNFSEPLNKPKPFQLVDKSQQINKINSKAYSRSDSDEESTIKDKNKLLYTFNYTLGFHGHHENGFRNGDKEGDYFFDGKDGTKRNVTYIANEFGYQPNITLTDLNENEKRRFDENNENDHGLKGYEFKWFYTRRK